MNSMHILNLPVPVSSQSDFAEFRRVEPSEEFHFNPWLPAVLIHWVAAVAKPEYQQKKHVVRKRTVLHFVVV
jgi:hypothetical protein